jgi:dihydrofolate reductase
LNVYRAVRCLDDCHERTIRRSIYRAALPLADRIHLAVVDVEPAGDTFMPDFDRKAWREASAETFSRDAGHPYGYRYSVLERIRR